MIIFDDITVRYSGEDGPLPPCLSGINMEIPKGEVVLVTGPSGCGKTTLLRCINGLVPNFHEAEINGHVSVEGTEVSATPTRELARRVGMVFQDPRSEFFTFDATSELAFCCENFLVPTEEITARITRTAAATGITDLLDRRIVTMSSGQKQKLAVAAAMINEPEVLLFDEPSANLDAEGMQMLTEQMLRLKKNGMTLVIADHRLSYLAEVIDRCLVLDAGRIVADLDIHALRSRPPEWFDAHGLRPLALPTPAQWGPTPTDPVPGVRMRNLGFSYRGGPQLWHIEDITLQSGQIIGVTGGNGVGKTTLLRVVVGLQHGGRGDLDLDAHRWPPRCRRRDCAMVTQDVEYQLMGESVISEMLIGAGDNPQNRDRAHGLLDRFGLADLAERHPLTLSGGQKQRLAIALACMKQARVVCLDEPTSGLDARNMRLVGGALRDLAEAGTLVLVTTHDREFADLCFDAHLVIADNEVHLHHLKGKPTP